MKVFVLAVLTLVTTTLLAEDRNQLELDMIRAQRSALEALTDTVMESHRDRAISSYQSRVDDSARCRPLQLKFATEGKRFPNAFGGSFITAMQKIMKEVEAAQCVYGKAPSEEELAKLSEEQREHENRKKAFQAQNARTEGRNNHLIALKKDCELAHALNRKQPTREHILAADEACAKYEEAQAAHGSNAPDGTAEFTLR